MGQSELATVLVVETSPQHQPQIGDRVRFRDGQAPAALRGREDAIEMVIVLVTRGGSERWPIVHFGNYITTVMPPGLLDVVESATVNREDPEGTN